ncbi:hypothetical protein ADK60_21220 [Streptomyces sp. XY431]|uniref:hypothetical protein n=1 Tax=Streptomyces sp. XY431 TaxID=1415562 RepID=UPI0006C1FD3E|nr:hypothetical protein [Streptomyces sp. XY431]KOV26382.1 hypothetical protein ADK60_21220 [Streptomyces sp. XY431]
MIARPDEATRSLGTLEVAIWDEYQPQLAWALVDTVVITHRPNAADSGLVDIVVGTGVVERAEVWCGAGPGTMPTVPRFEVHALSHRGGRTGECLGIDGLLVPREAQADIPLRLIGCEPDEPLPAAGRDPRAWTTEWAALLALWGGADEAVAPAQRLASPASRAACLANGWPNSSGWPCRPPQARVLPHRASTSRSR